MHKLDIPAHAIERAVRRKGKRHAHDDVPARQTALVVVDMQNYFMAPGQQVEIPMAREIVPNVNRLAQALREAGGRVIWIRTIAHAQAAAGWSHFHDTLNTPARDARRAADLRDGAFGAALWPGLDVRPDDLIVTKTRYSALIPGSSNLEAVLRGDGITAVLIAGTATNICCESTARDAMLLNFRTTMVSDANAAEHDSEHNATLATFCVTFGDVASCDELIERFRREKAVPQRVAAAS